MGIVFQNEGISKGDVRIGDDVWIGERAIIYYLAYILVRVL